MAISNEQLAELILGFAKSQNAIIEALTHHFGDGTAGTRFRDQYVTPTLHNYARIRDHAENPTFEDLPAQVLWRLQGSHKANDQPIKEWLEQELARLTS